MKYSEIVQHLSNRGFATREKWDGKSYIFFGIDNILWDITIFNKKYNGENQYKNIFYKKEYFSPCLQDYSCDDWVALDCHWDDYTEDKIDTDDFRPFNMGMLSLKPIMIKATEKKLEFCFTCNKKLGEIAILQDSKYFCSVECQNTHIIKELEEQNWVLKTLLELTGEDRLYKNSNQALCEADYHLLHKCYKNKMTQYEASQKVMEEIPQPEHDIISGAMKLN